MRRIRARVRAAGLAAIATTVLVAPLLVSTPAEARLIPKAELSISKAVADHGPTVEFNPALSNTGLNGHLEWVEDGLRVYTEADLDSCVSPVPVVEDPVVDPVLKTFGKTFYVGEKPGLAQIAKLANNLLAAAAIVLSSEAVAMGVKAGLDAKTLCDIINAGSGRNSATQDKFPKAVIPRTFDFGFATGLSYKDVRLCLDEAEALGVPMVAGAAVRQMLAITNAKFGPESDFTSIARVVEEWAGVEIK